MTVEPMHGDERKVIPLRRPGQAPRLFTDGDAPDEVEVFDDVLEGEVVGEEVEWEALPVLHRAAVVVRETVTSDAARTAARQASYLVVGASVARRRWKDARGGRYERMMSAAEAMGDHEAVLKWAEMAAQSAADRHSRRMERAASWGRHIERLPLYAKASAGTLGGMGVLLAIASKDAAMVTAPFLTVADVVQWAVHLVSILWGPALVSILWGPALVSAPVIGLLVLWTMGARNASASEISWVRALNPAVDAEDEAPITPSVVVTAFRNLGISALRKAIDTMGEAGAAMLGLITPAGCGVEVEVQLPIGTSTQEVQERHRKLAENLGRHEHEVFITLHKKARVLRLFIADSGALDEPIGPSPLVADTNIKADYYTGRAPWGQTLRGLLATVNLFQQHLLITGKSNQGKTASLRALLLWLIFDVTVEPRIADLKGVGDWRMFDGIATELIQGPTDEHCMAATHMVEAAAEEMNKRLTALEKSGSEDGVTRDMARTPGSGFHPIVLVVDEAQKVFMCPAVDSAKRPYGGKKHNSRFYNAVREIQNQGRAVNVTIWLGTQDPTNENLPVIVREPAHLRIALYLATESQAQMALGEAPVKQGAAPHKLRDGIDRGTVVAHGPGIEVPRGEPAVTIRTHYIDGKDATALAERAKTRRARITTGSGRTQEIEAPRDLLEDLDQVLQAHTDRVRMADVPSWLRDLAPGYGPYESLTGLDLAAKLEDYGIKTTNTGNVLRLDPKAFRTGLQRAATQAHTTE